MNTEQELYFDLYIGSTVNLATMLGPRKSTSCRVKMQLVIFDSTIDHGLLACK